MYLMQEENFENYPGIRSPSNINLNVGVKLTFGGQHCSSYMYGIDMYAGF